HGRTTAPSRNSAGSSKSSAAAPLGEHLAPASGTSTTSRPAGASGAKPTSTPAGSRSPGVSTETAASPRPLTLATVDGRGWEVPIGVVIVVHGQGDLLQVQPALGLVPGPLTRVRTPGGGVSRGRPVVSGRPLGRRIERPLPCGGLRRPSRVAQHPN